MMQHVTRIRSILPIALTPCTAQGQCECGQLRDSVRELSREGSRLSARACSWRTLSWHTEWACMQPRRAHRYVWWIPKTAFWWVFLSIAYCTTFASLCTPHGGHGRPH